MKKFKEWLDKADQEQKNQNNVFYPSMEPDEAIDILIYYLLGEDWYVADPVTPKQINTYAVYDILFKYSKKFRKEIK